MYLIHIYYCFWLVLYNRLPLFNAALRSETSERLDLLDNNTHGNPQESLLYNLSYSSLIENVSKQLNMTNIRRRLTYIENQQYLNPNLYKRKDGCDFSQLVAEFHPETLPLTCNNMNEVILKKEIGRGYWRFVYEAEWKGIKYAVKIVKEEHMTRNDIIPRHVVEAAVLYQLRNAENIVGIVGWCNEILVVPYFTGQLDELIFRRNDTVDVATALKFALDAAKGVAQLHAVLSGPIAHTDLQTRQFLYDETGKVFLNDFNRLDYAGNSLLPARKGGDNKCYFRTRIAKGKWRSPEEYNDERTLSEKLDIYSLCIVLWTFRSRLPPFFDRSHEEVYAEVANNYIIPDVERMNDYPLKMQKLIIQGWHSNPNKRPSAQEMVDQIEIIIQEFHKKSNKLRRHKKL